ncbi:ArsB/NhaD family transporter [Nitrolancea hollandica]|uniref:Putative Arsenical pump membrane protein n=1 Tax=Nitrolancea hollandica Lb TaxID=1129897 RepID=I4EDH5_9BACT|nr:ArsB/NhaD family transporter [Nitrolancea hollandica]CCF82737.1 putative Arsenical pump membrane protein [Nitrolancea hollandica Lb]
MSPLVWLSVAILVLTLALMLIRPHGITEAWFASGGALLMLLLGIVRLSDIGAVIVETSDVLLFLLGMVLLTDLADGAGVFDWLAEVSSKLAFGSGLLLFLNVFVLGALVTTFLSLDVTVLVLTPIVYDLAGRRKVDAVPYLFACTFVANTASLVLPISNLTNLLLFNQLQLRFIDFVQVMWLPNLAAVAVNFAIFVWLFRCRIPRRMKVASTGMPPVDWWFGAASIVLTATLVGLLWLGLAGLPLSWAALAGAAVLLGIGLSSGRTRAAPVVRRVPWSLFVFIVGMFVVVRGFERYWLANLTSTTVPGGLLPALLVSVGGTTIGSNIVNNVPMTVLAIAALQHFTGETQRAMTYGAVIGTDIGPILTTYGSVATMLWLALLRKRGVDISTGQYMKIGAITLPPVLLAATVTLWLVLRF